ADVLKVDDQYVQVIQDLRRRLQAGERVAVQADPPVGVGPAAARPDRNQVLSLAGEPVLRAEQGDEVRVGREEGLGRSELIVNRRRVRDEPDPLAAEPSEPLPYDDVEAGE